MNLAFVFVAAILVWLNKKYLQNYEMKMMDMKSGGKIKHIAVSIFILINAVGLVLFAYNQLL